MHENGPSTKLTFLLSSYQLPMSTFLSYFCSVFQPGNPHFPGSFIAPISGNAAMTCVNCTSEYWKSLQSFLSLFENYHSEWIESTCFDNRIYLYSCYATKPYACALNTTVGFSFSLKFSKRFSMAYKIQDATTKCIIGTSQTKNKLITIILCMYDKEWKFTWFPFWTELY